MNKRRKGGLPLFRRKRLLVALLVAGYLCGVVLGCFIIWAIPIARNKTNMLEIAYDKGTEYLYYGQADPTMIYGMDHWFFSERSQLIYHEAAFLHADQWDEIRAYVPEVLEKGELYIPTTFLLDNREEDPSRVFGILAATAVESPSGYRFVSILLRDLNDLDTTMITYVAIFSILYLVGILFTTAIIRKERDLNRMRRDLIANVSHELKTPITAIRAMGEVLHDGMIKDQATKHTYSRKIIEETDKLEQLVLDILELSRLQSNRAEFKKSSAFADGIIPPVIDRYMMLCGDLGITLDTSDLDLENTPMICTDPEKLVTLINILMDNAVKFTGEGGTIWVSNQIHPKFVTFCIRDNGPGIRTEDVKRIFDRFYKADVAHNTTGSGLGLAIADEIAKGLGEKIWVESTYGAGTSFYFTINYK